MLLVKRVGLGLAGDLGFRLARGKRRNKSVQERPSHLLPPVDSQEWPQDSDGHGAHEKRKRQL
ncbi:MAG: hypothetical protein A2341_00215 [Deltaproteobacteria bacterium RIFOXYB12_FULL_58_9]|nr:MAG: hypothetical protein A2341_00215 [Deltaproteobacteria bacterium RIFOXYB12_FULL_58_9]